MTYDSKPDFTDYGLGCFLLAGSEVFRLTRLKDSQRRTCRENRALRRGQA